MYFHNQDKLANWMQDQINKDRWLYVAMQRRDAEVLLELAIDCVGENDLTKIHLENIDFEGGPGFCIKIAALPKKIFSVDKIAEKIGVSDMDLQGGRLEQSFFLIPKTVHESIAHWLVALVDVPTMYNAN